MIINKLVFPIKVDLSFVEGGIPQGKLTANSINRDILYVISPAVKATVITAFFQNQKQTEDTQQATFVLSDLSIDYLVSKDTSYYELVKDWNVWQTQIPSKALEFISYNRAGKIGISFAFRQLLEPSGYEGSQEIKSDDFVITNSGRYIIKVPYYHFLGIDFTYNDVLIYNGGSEVYKKPAIALQGTTGTLEYSVDPSVYMGGYEYIDISLTESILSKLQSLEADLDVNFELELGQHKTDPLAHSDIRQDIQDLDDNKVDKVETPTVDPVIERVYGTKSDGTQTTFQLTNLELQPNTIVKRNESGKIYDLEFHDSDNNAHPDIRTMLQAVRGAFVYRGKANFTTEYLRQYTGELSSIIILEYGRDAVMGDVLVDLDGVEWYFNGDNWFEYGQGQIALATALNDGLLGKEDYAKIQTMYGNLNWDSDRGSVIDPIAFKLIRLGVDQSINDYIANNQVYINTRYTYFKNDFSSIVGESIGDLIIQSGGGSIDEVDGATTPIMLKTGSQETLDEDDTLKERELVYSSDKNIFGIYYDNKIRWQGAPLVIEPIIRVRSFGASDSKLSYVGMSPTLKLFQDGDINYYTNDVFDTMYPFRDMKEVEDELGNKFIEIPPFYVKYIVDENDIITGYDIANYKVDEDYGISQAFIDVISGEVKPLWFGKYMANVDGNDKMTSKSGVMADASQTLYWFRQRAKNNGLGYYQNSLYTWQIVQMLMWTYFGSINSDDFFPDINYESYVNNGSMDSVPYKVAYDSTTGKNTFFGIENILKEKRHFIDGVLLNIPNMYVAKDFRKFATDTTTNYDLVSTSLPTTSAYIVSMAYENGVMYPKVITGGSSGTYFADYYYQETGNRILYGGSNRASGANSGMSYWLGNRDSSFSGANVGSRLMYSPLTPTE